MMDDSEVRMFDDYWRTVRRTEEYIRRYGHQGYVDCEGERDPHLDMAYSQVRPLLASVTRLQMFYHLPGGLNPFMAENNHHLLIQILNPPEQWFGSVGVLCSPEYLKLKKAVEEEERGVAQLSAAGASEKSTGSPLQEVNDTALAILESIDLQEPQTWREIARRAGYTYDVARRYSKRLQDAKLIRKVGQRGFVRLIQLPGDCDSV